jgi:hypothetical protein
MGPAPLSGGGFALGGRRCGQRRPGVGCVWSCSALSACGGSLGAQSGLQHGVGNALRTGLEPGLAFGCDSGHGRWPWADHGCGPSSARAADSPPGPPSDASAGRQSCSWRHQALRAGWPSAAQRPTSGRGCRPSVTAYPRRPCARGDGDAPLWLWSAASAPLPLSAGGRGSSGQQLLHVRHIDTGIPTPFPGQRQNLCPKVIPE